MSKRTQADKLRAMFDSDRLRIGKVGAFDILEEWKDPVEQWAEALMAVSSSLSSAHDNAEAWECAEDREDRAYAKEAALADIEQLLAEIMGLDELPDLPNLAESPSEFAIVRTSGEEAQP